MFTSEQLVIYFSSVGYFLFSKDELPLFHTRNAKRNKMRE